MEDKKTVKVSLGTVICIVIIVILLIACGGLYYLGFMKKADKTESNIQIASNEEKIDNTVNTAETNIKPSDTQTAETKTIQSNSNIPTTDLFSIYCEANDENGCLFFSYIDNGNLYYFVNFDKKDGNMQGAFDFSTNFASSYNIDQMKKYNGLSNIKRIKSYNAGTGVNPEIYLITEDGKVYRANIHDTSINNVLEAKLIESLKQYVVEDIISYDGEMKSEFKLLLKDGTQKTVQETFND